MRGRLLSLLKAAKNMSLASSSLHTCKKAVATSYNIPSINSSSAINFTPLAPRRLAGFAHDIARGMEYIVQKQVNYTKLKLLLKLIGRLKIFAVHRLFMVISQLEMSYLIIMEYVKYVILVCHLIWK